MSSTDMTGHAVGEGLVAVNDQPRELPEAASVGVGEHHDAMMDVEQAALSGPPADEIPAIPEVAKANLGLTGQWLASMRERSGHVQTSGVCERKADWVDKAKHDMACKKGHDFVEIRQPEGWDALSSSVDPAGGVMENAGCDAHGDQQAEPQRKCKKKKVTKKTQEKKKRLSRGRDKIKQKRARHAEPDAVQKKKKSKRCADPQNQDANEDDTQAKPSTNRKPTAKASKPTSKPSHASPEGKPKAKAKAQAKAKAKAKAKATAQAKAKSTAARPRTQPAEISERPKRSRGQPLDDPVKEAARLKKSRKSIAYHEAYARAEGMGFPEDQCKEQARAAPCQHYCADTHAILHMHFHAHVRACTPL